MRLLISTHARLLLVLLNADLSEAEVSEVSSGHLFYGIAATSEDVWVVCNSYDHGEPAHIEGLHSGRRLVFETPISDVHQMTYANGGLYLCNTLYNGVVYKNLSTGVEHVYTLGGAFEHDYAHPNSIWVNGEDVYVLLHNKRFRASEIARLRHTPKAGFDVGYHAETRKRLPHAACHNLRFDGPLLTYLASEDSTVAQLDRITGAFGRGIPTPKAYLKGLVASEESFVIGLNPHVAAAKRPEVEAALGVVDRLDEGFRRVVPLELESGEPSGNINEIRRLPEEARG